MSTTLAALLSEHSGAISETFGYIALRVRDD